jgi:SEC-C motif-containing protein
LGKVFEQCCGRYIDHGGAPTAEALMRSRYTAYVLGNHDYLLQTWHPDSRPEQLGGTALKWIGLEVVALEKGLEHDQHGRVVFIASFRDGSRGKRLHESSRFIRIDNQWLYLDGKCSVSNIGRNDACPCGGGKKFKRCCGAVT